MLDHEFMEFAASLPADLKLRGTTTKYIFKKAVRQPAAGRHHRPAQEGLQRSARVVVPERAARDERRPAARSAACGAAGYFKPGAVQRLLEEHWRGAAVVAEPALDLLMLESWHRMFIDERPPAAPSAPLTGGR